MQRLSGSDISGFVLLVLVLENALKSHHLQGLFQSIPVFNQFLIPSFNASISFQSVTPLPSLSLSLSVCDLHVHMPAQATCCFSRWETYLAYQW